MEDENGLIEIDSEQYRADQRGMDQVEFFLAPNVGEEMRPLSKIASGGEVSRIMLALKSAHASIEDVPVLVFDEIDIGIVGMIAEIVGEKLHGLTRNHQVICITHLPQIASLSDTHFSVSKNIQNGRTRTSINRLTASEKVEEIANLLGGKTITPLVRKHAREMVERASTREVRS